VSKLAEIQALLATPGAFEDWNEQVQRVAGTVRLRNSTLAAPESRRDTDFDFCHRNLQGELAKLDEYGAEVRRRYEADLIRSVCLGLGFEPEDVDEAIRVALGVEP
jgi:hypothetical protein